MNEAEIVSEAKQEISKNIQELIKDSIREANTLPKSLASAASEKENLDIIKRLVKRLAIHQLILTQRADNTNRLLLILSFISAIGVIFSVWSYFSQYI